MKLLDPVTVKRAVCPDTSGSNMQSKKEDNTNFVSVWVSVSVLSEWCNASSTHTRLLLYQLCEVMHMPTHTHKHTHYSKVYNLNTTLCTLNCTACVRERWLLKLDSLPFVPVSTLLASPLPSWLCPLSGFTPKPDHKRAHIFDQCWSFSHDLR